MRLTISFLFAASVFAQSPSSFENHLAAAQTAMQHSRYAEADTQLRAAVAEAAQPDPNRTPLREAEAYSALCDLDLLMSRYDEGIAMASKALDTAKAANAPDLTPNLGRLAAAYRVAGKTALAVPLLEQILGLDQMLGADDPKVSVDYDKLGSAYMELFRMDDARVAYQKAIDTRISKLGPDHIDVATALVSLGVLEERNVKPKAAQADFEKALAISEKNLGTESYGLTGILDRLGRLFSNQKLYSDAEPEFQRSLAIREKVLGSRHSDLAPALDNLGMAYFFDGKYIDAEPVFQRSLAIWLSTQGPTSPLVAEALDNLGALYSAQKRFADAEPMFKKALAIRETQDIDSLSNLGLLYEATNDMKRSDEYFQRALLVGEKGLGGEHPEVTGTLKEYATMLHAAGRLADAKKVEAHEKDLEDKLSAQKVSGPETVEGRGPAAGPVQK
jgi:tetratricopeptide (TPR) repeat protein